MSLRVYLDLNKWVDGVGDGLNGESCAGRPPVWPLPP